MNTSTKNRHGRNRGFSGRKKTFSNPLSKSKDRFKKSRPGSSGRSSFRGSGKRNGGGIRKLSSFNPSRFINATQMSVVNEVYKLTHDTFATFGLDTRLVRTVAKIGIDTPTPIQDQVIPKLMNGHDVIGIAETGTGKTAAFLLPLIDKTGKNGKNLTLIMTPTRELALQIDEEFKKLSNGFQLFSTVCVGGMNIRSQIKSLHRTNHFVIGTPGRILDLIRRKDFNPTKVTDVVLDEADRMLDMGFIHDMRKILDATPKNRRTLFFSATMGKNAKALVNDFMNNPVVIAVKKKDVIDTIKQDVVKHTRINKFETLLALLKKPEYKRVIIFGSMKHSVKRLAMDLTQKGMKAESMHGNKSHAQRQNTLRLFKNGSTSVLVATDIAARGIHIDDVSHVINYELPGTFEEYIHRIGRTGRATKRGNALTFVLE